MSLTLFLLIVFGIYFLLLLALIVGWGRVLKKKPKEKITAHHAITVIIPFRNEEVRLASIAADLHAQNYLPENFSVLFVDDHSHDNSVEILNTAIHGKSNIRLISLPPEVSGKKRAIDYGIHMATSNLIVTTDADCRIPEAWLSAIDQVFQDKKVQLVFGGVRILQATTVFSQLQSLEFSSLIGSGASTLGLGFPTMCNGANMAYRKSAYEEVNGFEGNFDVASGDDEFLMRKIDKQNPGSISFLNNERAVVSTYAQPTVRDFINQRLRWAGKWKHNQSLVSKLLALFILLFHTTFVVSIVLVVAGEVRLSFVGILIAGKILLEYIFLSRVNSFLNQSVGTIYFLVLQFIHPLYVVVIGFLSQGGRYSWKERSLTHKR